MQKPIELSQDNCFSPSWQDYLELCKPRVVWLMLLTAVVGMQLASPGLVDLQTLIFASLGIGLSASCGAIVNHLVDRRIDAIMWRTKRRPIPTGKVSAKAAFYFAMVLGIAGMAILILFINMLTAILTLASLIGYAVVYTMFLKRTTPQNIVIGGAAGAAPPLLGWTAVTGHLDPNALLLVAIIFTWTPPHFWALAIYRYEEYKKAEIPMLPVTHGIAYTKLNILLYSLLLLACTLLPYVTGMSGPVYGIGALLLGLRFTQYCYRLWRHPKHQWALKTFRFSIIYLMALFALLLLDHFLIHLT